jgi:ketosteroid isomerase-like protein
VTVTPGNVEIVRSNSDAFSRRDVEAMLVLWAPDATMSDRRAVGWGEYRGRDALRAYYLGLFDNVGALNEDLSVVSSEGDVVVVTCHTRVQLAGDPDGEVTFDYAMRITLAEGLITSLEIFEDVAAATGGG